MRKEVEKKKMQKYYKCRNAFLGSRKGKEGICCLLGITVIPVGEAQKKKLLLTYVVL
jgi:hypothetical protein